jgi:hypothetical protein
MRLRMRSLTIGCSRRSARSLGVSGLGFVEDVLWDRDFAEVVVFGCLGERVQFAGGEAELVAYAYGELGDGLSVFVQSGVDEGSFEKLS